jgi:hypothetical protein
MVVKKSLELPTAVARAFIRDIQAYFRAEPGTKQDLIAIRQLHALREFQRPREKLRLDDMVGMFLQMKDDL